MSDTTDTPEQSSPSGDAAPREFRPSWPRFHKQLLIRMLFAGPILILVVLAASWPSMGFAFVLLGSAFLIGGLILSVYFSSRRVTVQESTVRSRNGLIRRAWSTYDMFALVRVPQIGGRADASGPASASLYAVSHQQERLFWLSGDYWERATLDEFADATGVRIIDVPTGLSVQEIRTRFPGTLGWTNERPMLFALLVAAIASAAAIVIANIVVVILVATGTITLDSLGAVTG